MHRFNNVNSEFCKFIIIPNLISEKNPQVEKWVRNLDLPTIFITIIANSSD